VVGEATPVATWNFTVAHLYGTPRLMEPDENEALLTRLARDFDGTSRARSLSTAACSTTSPGKQSPCTWRSTGSSATSR
jgi:predicted FMN-binding regulatory protein PaiB